jgi:ABC-type oligopeptide transport system substrate-binding subunit
VRKRVFLILALASLVMLAACSARTSQPAEKLATVEVTVPVVQTRIVEVTRPVPVTVVVTATPEPTPFYVSKINVPAGTLAYPLAGNPQILDPQEAEDEVSLLVLQQLYEGLFHLRADGSLSPAAATGYEVSADGTVYTVTLRAGMTWSDGQPVTAQHYVDGVCRLLDPAIGNSYYYLLTDIARVKGARDYAHGEVTDCATVGVKAADELTLVITLDQPASFLPKLLAMRAFWPTRLDLAGGEEATAAGRLVSNGPYLLTEQIPNRSLTLVRNPAYWNAEQVAIEKIAFLIVPEPAAQLALFKAGELHVADFPAEETSRILAEPGLSRELQVLVRPGTSYLGFNTQVSPTSDVNFRRAIASAIDRRYLIEEVLQQPWHHPAQVVVPPGISGYQGDDPALGYPYDPEKAKAYLAEAGYDENHPPPPVELWFNREGNNPLLFQAIGRLLEEVGIPVRLVSSSWDVYLASLNACNKPNRPDAAHSPAECSYNLYRMGWVMDYADPSGILDMVFSPRSAFQYTGWQSEEYEKLLIKALAEQDEARRNELYRAAEKILLNEAVAVVPLIHYDRTLLIKEGVVFEYPPFGAPDLQYWRLP